MGDNEYKISLGIELDTDDIASQIRGIRTNERVNIGVELNSRDVENQIANIRRQIQELGNIRINIGGNIGGGNGGRSNNGFIGNINNNISQIMTTANNATNTIQRLRQTLASAKFDNASIDLVTQHLEQMNMAVTNVTSRIRNNNLRLNITGTDELGRTVTVLKEINLATGQITNIGKNISQSFGRTREEVQQTNAAYREMKSLIKEISNTSININKAREAGQEFAALEIKLAALNTRYDELETNFAGGFDVNQVRNLSNEWAKSAHNINVANEALSNKSNANTLKEINKEMTNFVKLQNQIGQKRVEIGKLESIGGNTNQIAELNRQLEELETTYDGLMQTFMKKLNVNADIVPMDDINKFDDEIAAATQRAENELRELDAKVADTKNRLASDIKLKLSDGTLNNDLSNINSKFNRLSNQSNDLKMDIDSVEQALREMGSAARNNDIDSLISSYNNYQKALKNVNNQLQINARTERDNAAAQKLVDDRTAFQSKIDAWLTKNSAASKKFGASMLELKAKAESCDKVTLNHLEAEFKQLDKAAEAAGLKTQNLSDRIKTQFSKYSQYLSVASVFMYAEQGLRDMFEQVVAIDTAMTELKKVTDETDASYDRFLTNAAQKSKEIGTTIDGLVTSTADFARLGYGFEDAQGLAEVANIYAVVGDEIEGVEGATESLVSTLAAFKDEMNGLSDSDFAMSIVDKFNEVSNNFAISSGGIGEALQRSASSMAAANNTLDETIALITAANTVVQDPDRVGNAFKTVSMRIRGAKTELEEAGLETDGMVDSTAKLRQEILALSGVDIMLNENTFKSTYQTLDELSVKWEDLSDIAQASITELIAGKHQGNVISSLMSNFDIAREALETSLDSSGSAMKEHEKWQKSLEARINSLKATWQSLSQTFMSSDFLKSALDGIIALVNGVDKLIDTFGTVPTILTAFAAFKSFSGNGFFRVIEDQAAASGKRMTNAFSASISEVNRIFNSLGVKTNTAFKNSFNFDIKSLQNYKNAVKNGMEPTQAYATYMADASEKAKQLAKNVNLTSKDILNFGKQQKAANVTLQAQNKTWASAKAIMQEYNSGCKNTAMSQKDFISAVSAGNSGLGKYLSGVKAGSATMRGYATSLAATTIKTFALEAATMALNAALTMGISIAISAIIKAFDEWYVSADELAEKVDEVTSKYKEQHDSLTKLKGNYDTSNESSMISKYEKLSKGVDGLGKNVSLTADEYSEYQSIVSTIAEQIPSLVSGYDSQGNAILSCAGNVKKLTAEYEKLIKAQNDEVLVNNTSDINDDFRNAVKDAESNTEGFFGWNWTKKLNLGSSKLSTESAKTFKNILESTNAIAEFDNVFSNWNTSGLEEDEILTDLRAMSNLLEEAGFEKDGFFEDQEAHVRRALKENKSLVNNIVDQYYASLEEEIEGKKSQAQAALSNAFDLSDSIYYGMSDTLKNIAQQTVSAFDFEFFADLDEQGVSVEKYVNTMLDQLNSLSNSDKSSIEMAFNLKTQFNGGEISYGEYVNGLEDAGKLVDRLGLSEELTSQIKLNLGLDEKGLVENYQTLLNRLTETSNEKIASGNIIGLDLKEAENLLNSLSSEELSVMTQILPEIDANATREQIEAAINREMVLQGLTFDLNLEVEAAGIESLNTALAESVTASGLSSDSISALKSRYADLESQGYDLSSMFEETSHGIHVNRNELSKFENELSKQKLAEVDADLTEMKAAYDELGEAIRNCDDPLKKSELYNERQSLAQKISECATLASQYEGLTSAYNDWLAAEEAGNERDMYENVISGFETVKDELSRGWADDSTIEFLEMITGRTDLAGKSGKELKEIYDGLDKTIKNTTHSVRDFFTVDDEGNSTSKGVYNFLDAVGQLEEEAFGGKDIVKRDGKGNVIGFDFELAGGDEVIAEALGVSEELVQIMVRAADDAGFVVSMDGTYKQLADLQNEAKAAADYLKEIGKTDFEFDFNTSNVKNLKDQLKEAKSILKDKSFWNKDGTFNFDAKGATEAMQVVSTLQAKLDSLTQEQYGIGLTVEDKEFEEPLENLQDYGKKVAALNQLELNPKANAEEIEELNGELDDIAKYFANLDGDTKVKIGLEADDNVEEVKKKIESGEIKIPTTLDIQTNMDKNLSDLRDLALLNSGYLSEEQEKAIKIRLGIEVEAGKIDDSKLKEDIENGVHDNSAYWSENKPKVTTESDVELKAGEVDTTDVDEAVKNEVKTGSEGQKSYRIGVPVDTKLETENVDDSDVKEKTEKAVKSESGKTETVEKEVELELKIGDYIDNLSEFEDVAKRISELDKDISTTVTANIEGNVLGAEGDINSLATFAEGAKELQDVKSSDVSVKVELECEFNGGDFDSLAKFVESASKLDGVKSSDVSVEVELDGNLSEYKGNLEDIGIFAKNAKELNGVEDSNVSIKVALESEFNETNFDDLAKFVANAKDLQGIKDSEVSINASLDGNLGENVNIDKLQTFAECAKAVQDLESKEVKVTTNLYGNLIQNPNLHNLGKFADGVEKLQDVKGKEVEVTTNLYGNLTQNPNLYGIDEFAEGVEKLQDVKSKEVEVTANLYGNLIQNHNLYSLDDFAEGSKELQDVKSKEVEVTANLYGNLVGNPNLYSLDDFADGAAELQDVEGKKVEITASLYGNLTQNPNLYSLDDFADGAKDLQGIKSKKVEITTNLYGNLVQNPNLYNLDTFADGAEELQGIESKSVRIDANLYGNLIGNGNLNNLGTFASRAKELKGIGNVNVSVKANVDTVSINTAVTLLSQVANSGLFKDYNATVNAKAVVNDIDDSKVQNYKAPPKEAKVKYSVDSSKVDSWAAPSKDGVVNYSAKVDALTDAQKHKTGTITYKANIVGLGPAAGTAHASGSAKANGLTGRAFARGDWGIKGSGVALGGELGQELVVRDGKFFTIGDAGAEFFHYKKNDIVFNAAQTASLFKYGGIKGANPRGKMLASGTAFADGNAFSSGSGGGLNPVTGESYGSKDSSSSDKDFKETFDWIETILDRVERSIDKFDQQANNIYKSWSSRNNALLNQISEVNKEIGLQQQAKSKYMSAANGVGLSSSWAAKVRNGEIDIDTIKDEALADKIQSYTEYYEKVLDCEKAIEELKETESELYAQRVENVATQYENQLSIIEHEKNMLEEYISQSEAQGWLTSTKYYDALAEVEKDNIAKLQDEKVDLLAQLQEGIDSGKIIKNTEGWYELVNMIDDVTLNIEKSNTALLEYKQTIQELEFEQFDLLQDRISAVTEETEFLIELMSNKKLYEDSGQLTDEGMTTMGLHGQNYNVYMHQADMVAEEIERIQEMMNSNQSDQFDVKLLEEQYREMISLQQEYILNAEDEKNAIRDMVEDGIELELDALQEKIDLYNEALDSQKDLYDYQKKVEEQTKEIASIEKQMAAYAGDNSEEAKAKLQELKVSLEQAESDLEETQYEKYISDQEALLDALYLEYETILNERLDNIDALVMDMIAEINANAGTISATIDEVTRAVGYETSEEMKATWDADTVKITDVITAYREDFYKTTTATKIVLDAIKLNTSNMISKLDSIASEKAKTAAKSSAAKKTTTGSNNNNKNNTNVNNNKPSSGGDGTPKVGDKVKFISGKYYYDSYGTKPLGSKYQGKEVYITNINKKGSHPYHISTGSKIGKGDLGWLKLNQLSGYATGKKNFLDNETAWTQENGQEFIIRPSDGAILTPIAKGDSVLTSAASNNIWDMANSPAEFIRDNLNLGSANVPNNQTVQNGYSQTIESVVFSMPNVRNYDELITQMQRDPNFERLVEAMSIGKLAGKSSLTKGKAIR